ncbi:MAG: DUF6477 family protein [Rhodobacteraceae bacterium]|nr:DUF6477 family protein [Paracoccaceae bacterium]
MHIDLGTLEKLNRPRLLIRTARLGLKDYCRNRHLPAVLGMGSCKGGNKVLSTLVELEAEANALRVEQHATYSIRRHIELLIALMAEVRILRYPTLQ